MNDAENLSKLLGHVTPAVFHEFMVDKFGLDLVDLDDDQTKREQRAAMESFKFHTGLAYLAYEPGDLMALQASLGEAYAVRITRCQYDGQGTLIWTAALDDPSVYPSPSSSPSVQGGTAAGAAPQRVDYSGPSFLTVMDVPPLRATDTSQGLYLAACGAAANWPGCAVQWSRDGSSYAQLTNVGKPAVMGFAQSVLPAFGGGNQSDELSTVTVVLYGGSLSSCSYGDFLNGVNAAYIGGEIVYFRNATQIAANTYTLSGLLRERAGTGYASATHAAGEAFVLLDPTRIFPLPINLSDIGATLYFETFLLNLFGTTPSSMQKMVPSNAHVKPLRFSPGRSARSETF